MNYKSNKKCALISLSAIILTIVISAVIAFAVAFRLQKSKESSRNESMTTSMTTINHTSVYGNYPAVHNPPNAIDSNLDTKYLNFGSNNCGTCYVNGPGVGTGYLIIPAISNLTIARAVLFAIANDVPERDPLTITLEESTTSNISLLYLAESWTLIYNGSTGINPTTDPGRNVYVTRQNFSNTIPYTSYRLLITSQRGPHNAVQYAEGRILGYVVS